MVRSSEAAVVRRFMDATVTSQIDRHVQNFLRAVCIYLAENPDELVDFQQVETWERFGVRDPYNETPRGRAGCAFALANSDYKRDQHLPVVFDKSKDEHNRNMYRIRSNLREVLIESGRQLLRSAARDES